MTNFLFSLQLSQAAPTQGDGKKHHSEGEWLIFLLSFSQPQVLQKKSVVGNGEVNIGLRERAMRVRRHYCWGGV